jgi:hypothetical protein
MKMGREGFTREESFGRFLHIGGRRRAIAHRSGCAFRMTGGENLEAVRFGMRPIVILLDNGEYVAARLMFEGGCNDILHWEGVALARARTQ